MPPAPACTSNSSSGHSTKSWTTLRSDWRGSGSSLQPPPQRVALSGHGAFRGRAGARSRRGYRARLSGCRCGGSRRNGLLRAGKTRSKRPRWQGRACGLLSVLDSQRGLLQSRRTGRVIAAAQHRCLGKTGWRSWTRPRASGAHASAGCCGRLGSVRLMPPRWLPRVTIGTSSAVPGYDRPILGTRCLARSNPPDRLCAYGTRSTIPEDPPPWPRRAGRGPTDSWFSILPFVCGVVFDETSEQVLTSGLITHFACCPGAQPPILPGSGPEKMATWHTNIRHLGYVLRAAPVLQSDQSLSRAPPVPPPPREARLFSCLRRPVRRPLRVGLVSRIEEPLIES